MIPVKDTKTERLQETRRQGEVSFKEISPDLL